MLGVLRSQLRGLVLRGGDFVSNPTSTYLSRINHHHALPSFLQVSQFGEFSTCKLKEKSPFFETLEQIQAEASYSSRMVQKPKRHARKRKQITNGDIVDLQGLLFTENRDYLVKYKDNQKVKAEHLAGKVIVLYFSLLNTNPFWTEDDYVTLLKDQYSELYPGNGFEIVFVAVKGQKHVLCRDSKKQFEEMFSLMPWTAIPFSDIPSRKSLHRKGFPKLDRPFPKFLIVDSTGLVLQCHNHAYNTLERYGFSGYPFSDERIFELISEYDDIIAKPSLHTLLASPQRDYVISNKAEKVPIHTLENKVVALYFSNGHTYEESQLKMIYEESKKNKKNFEVVLIYDSTEGRESFWETFKNMPWLALPYNGPNIKKLTRIFEYHWSTTGHVEVPSLVIFGPHGKFVNPYGGRIMENFGIRAYPFTCAEAVKLETEKTKNMRLEMLLDRNTVLTGKDGCKIPFSQLSGKRVLVIFEMSEYSNFEEIKFLKMLKELYLLQKGTCYEFEVIHSVFRPMKSSRALGDFPWIVTNASELLLPGDFFSFSSCQFDIFYSFVFFDRDGKLIRKMIRPMKGFKTLEFPFSGDSLEKDAWEQLSNTFLPGVQQISLDKMNLPISARDYEALNHRCNLFGIILIVCFLPFYCQTISSITKNYFFFQSYELLYPGNGFEIDFESR